MWSHYAKNHTGAVLEFLTLENSPFIYAEKVNYTKKFPVITGAELFDVPSLTTKVFDLIMLTKSEDWSYEKEWRVISTSRDKTKDFEILPFNKKELGAVYLGCKIDNVEREKVIGLTKEIYPWAKIYQTEKHPTEFKLMFKQILL